MRPVNLIPIEERRGQNAPLRTGPIAYIVVGALVAALGGVMLLVLTGNEIADRKSEVTQVRQEDALVAAEARRLAPYTEYQILSEQRVATVKSLADSRFDWERVMRELSLILPDNVWLTKLTATASPAVGVDGGGEGGGGEGSGLRGSIPGPALEMEGCASGQAGVAGFVAALKDIDGVTRVGVESSALPPTGTAAGTGEGGGGGATDCRTRGFIAEFKMVIAFDAAPIPPGEAEAEAVAAVPEAPPAESAEEPTSAPEG